MEEPPGRAGRLGDHLAVKPVTFADEQAVCVTAEGLVGLMKQNYSLALDFGPESVRALDTWINQYRWSIPANGVESMSLALGAYVGECLRRLIGGAWQYDDGRWGLHLPTEKLPEGISGVVFFPIARARRHFLEGRSRSIYAAFEIQVALCDPQVRPAHPLYPEVQRFLREARSCVEGEQAH